jgi:phage terminase large subunit-like protein
MITVTEYVGNSWDTAWSNIANGDSDSMTPKLVGRKGGKAIYRSIKKKRTYSAAWQPSASDSK